MNDWLQHPVIPKEAVTFTVPGKPVAWARAGLNGSRHFTNPKQAKYKTTIQSYAGLATRNMAWLEGPLYMFLLFKMPRPQKPKWKYPAVKPDRDNLEKIFCDAMNRVVYTDDAQVTHGMTHSIYVEPEKAGVEVAVWEIGG